MLSLHCILFFMSLITGEILLLYVCDNAFTEFTGPSGFPGGSVVKGRLSEYTAYTYWTLRCVGAGTVPIFFS